MGSTKWHEVESEAIKEVLKDLQILSSYRPTKKKKKRLRHGEGKEAKKVHHQKRKKKPMMPQTSQAPLTMTEYHFKRKRCQQKRKLLVELVQGQNLQVSLLKTNLAKMKIGRRKAWKD